MGNLWDNIKKQQESFNNLQTIIYWALMTARHTHLDLLEILDETCDWLDDEFYMLSYADEEEVK